MNALLARPFSSRPLWQLALLAIAWILLSLQLGQPVSAVLEPSLDSSIHASYAHFTAHGFQFGPEVNTTAGPYGFVAFGWDYSGELYWTRWALTVAFGLALSALILWFFLAARGGWERWLWAAAFLVGLTVGDVLYSLPALLCGLFFVLTYARPVPRLALWGVAALLAFSSLTKGTSLAISLAVLGVLGLLAARLSAWRRLLHVVAAFTVALLAWWVAAGQNPLHLPAYFDGLRHIASGYNEAMSYQESDYRFALGLGLAAAVLLGLGFATWRHRAQPVVLAACVLVAGLGFVAWKHGFVRADGHAFIFFDFGVLLLLSLLLALRIALAANPPAWCGALHALLLVSALGVSALGADDLLPGRTRGLFTGFGERFLLNARFTLWPEKVELDHATRLARLRDRHSLDSTVSEVGDRTIDFFGHDFGYLLLNGMNYRPAPMCCGSYHVYNRHFKDLNYAHFTSTRTRPDYVLLASQSIDDRWIPADDSLSFLALLSGYRPRLREHDGWNDAEMILLRAQPGQPELPRLRPLSSHSFRFGETIPVPAVAPDEMVLFSVDLPYSFAGILRGIFYKPPTVEMDVDGEQLTRPRGRRLIPGSIAVPALLSPAIERTADFLDLYSPHPAKLVRQLRVSSPVPDGFAADGLRVRFYVARRPAPLATGELRYAYPASVFAQLPAGPGSQDRGPMRYKDVFVRYLHAPASLSFELDGTERILDLRLGIDESAYLTGRTDGVDFHFELVLADGSVQTLARRALRPLTESADRGLLIQRVVLPPRAPPGTLLRIRTDPGPHGDAAWDWAFVTGVNLRHGPFIPAQFPGFRVLPESVGPVPCGPLGDGHRLVFMAGPGASLDFVLRPSQSQLVFTAGLLPGSYQGGGHTDGVDFIVEIVAPDGTVRPAGQLALRPATRPADRGNVTQSVDLPEHAPGERLRLRVTAGPGEDQSWDWSYLSNVDLR